MRPRVEKRFQMFFGLCFFLCLVLTIVALVGGSWQVAFICLACALTSAIAGTFAPGGRPGK